MQDSETTDEDVLRSLIDTPDYFYVNAWDEKGAVAGRILFELNSLRRLVENQFGLLSWQENPPNEFGRSYDFSFPPENRLRLLSVDADGARFIFEGVTPRELYRFLTEFIRIFPQKDKLYVVWGSIGYAWLRTDLPEEEAIVHMLSHDDAVRAELGLPEYDHSQW